MGNGKMVNFHYQQNNCMTAALMASEKRLNYKIFLCKSIHALFKRLKTYEKNPVIPTESYATLNRSLSWLFWLQRPREQALGETGVRGKRRVSPYPPLPTLLKHTNV